MERSDDNVGKKMHGNFGRLKEKRYFCIVKVRNMDQQVGDNVNIKITKKYDFSRIPPSWRYCFNRDCPMSRQCLRFQTGLELPADLQSGKAVFPTALSGGQCSFFRRDEKVRLASGFVIAGNPQLSSLFTALRHLIGNILGHGGTYYLYRNGKRWLTPAQQEAVTELMRDQGYTGEVVFAKYKDDYDFS